MKKIDLNLFNDLVNKKYVSVQKHNTADLLIWNYSQRCQFERYWTPETSMARGLITDQEGIIKARPFKKFFNLSEHTSEDSKLPPLPLESFEITEKLDGSLGILYWIGDKPYLATRGSFISDQAIKGTEILHKKYSHISFNQNYTYLVEILYPENRIVVDYKGLEDIILLAQIYTESGEEVSHKDYADVMPIVKQYDGITDISTLASLTEDNKEGFVVRFASGVRVKVKFEEYVRLHRLITGVNSKTIWDLLRNEQPFDELLEKVPDEYFDWVRRTRDNLQDNYNIAEDLAKKRYDEVKDLPSRKDQALKLLDSNFRSVVFKMLDNQPYKDIIWKILRPVASKPFHQDIDA